MCYERTIMYASVSFKQAIASAEAAGHEQRVQLIMP
jgi:hypothetical protein